MAVRRAAGGPPCPRPQAGPRCGGRRRMGRMVFATLPQSRVPEVCRGGPGRSPLPRFITSLSFSSDYRTRFVLQECPGGLNRRSDGSEPGHRYPSGPAAPSSTRQVGLAPRSESARRHPRGPLRGCALGQLARPRRSKPDACTPLTAIRERATCRTTRISRYPHGPPETRRPPPCETTLSYPNPQSNRRE